MPVVWHSWSSLNWRVWIQPCLANSMSVASWWMIVVYLFFWFFPCTFSFWFVLPGVFYLSVSSILVMFDRLGLVCHGHSLHVCCFSLELLFPICICWLQLSCKKLLMRRWGSSEDLCNEELHFRLCLDMWWMTATNINSILVINQHRTCWLFCHYDRDSLSKTEG